MSWSRVLQLDEPVVGTVEDYESAHSQVSRLGEAAESVRDQFKRIRTSELEELQGEAAQQLREVVSSVDESLNVLPVVLDDVSAVFQYHAQALGNLRVKAEEALARAETRWNDLQSAIESEDQAASSLLYVRGQLRSLDSSGASPEHIDARRAQLAIEVSDCERRVRTCEATTSQAREDLELSRVEHGRLQDEEQDLIDRTVDALDRIDLRDLKNPGFLQGVWEGFGNFIGAIREWLQDFFEDIGKLASAILQGDFGAALHHLRNVLDKLATIMTVVAVLACLIAAPFTSGASLALIPAVFAAAKGMEYASLKIGVVLYCSGVPHPETGFPLSWQEVAVDAGLTLLPSGMKSLGKRGMKSLGVDEFYPKQISKVPPLKAVTGEATDALATKAASYKLKDRVVPKDWVVPETGQAWIDAAQQSLDKYRGGVSITDDRATCQLAPR